MTEIRRAREEEAVILTEIAAHSEAYWGYDSGFMDSFRSLYRVTEDFIRRSPVYVLEEDRITGFYALICSGNKATLEYLYVEPGHIGKGIGRKLWHHMIELMKKQGIKEVDLVTSPQAKAFYVKMGARLVGEVDSLVLKGRKVPRLVYTVKA